MTAAFALRAIPLRDFLTVMETGATLTGLRLLHGERNGD
jgi:hypothetical protein